MRNRDRSAFPAGEQETGDLTKREYAAIHIAAGLHSNPGSRDDLINTARIRKVPVAQEIASRARYHADALFDELERKPEPLPDPGPMHCDYCGASPPYVPGCHTDGCPHKEADA